MIFISCTPFVSIFRINYSELTEKSDIVAPAKAGKKITTSIF